MFLVMLLFICLMPVLVKAYGFVPSVETRILLTVPASRSAIDGHSILRYPKGIGADLKSSNYPISQIT